MNIDFNHIQANYNHQRSSQGISCYPESEYYSSPPEESKESLSFLLERVNYKVMVLDITVDMA